MSGTFMDKSFSVHLAGDQQYRDNWDATFGPKDKETAPIPEGEAPDTERDVCKDCDGTGRVWVSDEHHGHAVRIACRCGIGSIRYPRQP